MRRKTRTVHALSSLSGSSLILHERLRGVPFGYDFPMRVLAPKRRRSPEGVRVLLLQRQVERFSAARIDRAMQHAWKKEYDPQQFFSVAIPHDAGAVLHAFGAEIAIRHSEYALDWKAVGHDEALPFWAAHAGFSTLDYRCEKAPEDPTRLRMYRGLGMLAAELASEQTAGFFFPHEQVLLPHSEEVVDAFRDRGPLDPFDLEELAE